MKRNYDYVIVGAGLFGATFAFKAKQTGKKCLVIDKRPHLGGISIARILKASMSTSMEPTSSTLQTNRYGIL